VVRFLPIKTVLLWCALSDAQARAQTAFAIHRAGVVAPGDLICFDVTNPDGGKLLGNIGLSDVGTMDFFGDQLWLVSGDGGLLNFYTVDLDTVTASYQASFGGAFGGDGITFAGSFDSDGFYWVVDGVNEVLRKLNPNTGQSLASVSIAPSAWYNGIAFVGNVLYAVCGATGDPPQLFGILSTQTGQFQLIGRTYVGRNGEGGGNGSAALDYDPLSGTMYVVYRSGIAQGQFWSLYTIDIQTGAATFVGEIQPERNIDAFAIAPPALDAVRYLERLSQITSCLDGPAVRLTYGPCIAHELHLTNDLSMDLRDIQLFLNDVPDMVGCGSANHSASTD
jgi:hypothetical protein